MERLTWKVRVVMFAPKWICSGDEAPSRSATAARAASTMGHALPAGQERSAIVGVHGPEVADDRVDDPLRDLGAPRAVEVDDRSPILLQRQRRELVPDGHGVEGGHRSLPGWNRRATAS